MTAKSIAPNDHGYAHRMARWGGRRYGRLTVLRAWRVAGHTYAECSCECGRKWKGRAYNLQRGTTKSCGCLNLELVTLRAGALNVGHRQSETALYQVWLGMRQRCRNSQQPAHKWYGARGIEIAPEWESFARFASDMGSPPSKNHSLDRVDNDGPYSRQNCKWSDHTSQARNRRGNRRIEINGKALCISEWAEASGLKYATLRARIERGWTGQDLLKPADPTRCPHVFR